MYLWAGVELRAGSSVAGGGKVDCSNGSGNRQSGQVCHNDKLIHVELL